MEFWMAHMARQVSLSWVDTASAALTLDSGYHLRDDAGEAKEPGLNWLWINTY